MIVMHELVTEVVEIAKNGTEIGEAIEAVVLMHDLTGGQERTLVNFVHLYYKGV